MKDKVILIFFYILGWSVLIFLSMLFPSEIFLPVAGGITGALFFNIIAELVK